MVNLKFLVMHCVFLVLKFCVLCALSSFYCDHHSTTILRPAALKGHLFVFLNNWLLGMKVLLSYMYYNYHAARVCGSQYYPG